MNTQKGVTNQLRLFVFGPMISGSRGKVIGVKSSNQPTLEYSGIVRTKHPLALRSCTADDLKDYPAIHLTPNESRYYHVMDELYRQEYGNSVHMKEQIVYSSNTMEACIETLEDTNAILFFPSSMESYFKPFNIVSLSLSETQRMSSIGIYLLRERQNDQQLNDMMQLMQKSFTENQALVK